MRLVKDNIVEIPIKKIPKMFCLGGCNVCIEMNKIKSIEQLAWWGYDDENYTPILMITLQDGTKISVDYDSFDEAKKAMNEYKKEFIKKV